MQLEYQQKYNRKINEIIRPTVCHGDLLHMPHLFLGEAEKADNSIREWAEFVLHLKTLKIYHFINK